MKDRPILFSSEMVRALLDGSKSQTRRVIKLPEVGPCLAHQPDRDGNRVRGQWEASTVGGPGVRDSKGNPYAERAGMWHTGAALMIASPFAPGDRLYVRETWQYSCRPDSKASVVYRADGSARDAYYKDSGQGDFSHVGEPCALPSFDLALLKWRPAIFMPRGASRLTLEVTEVRAQRLQDISEEDAIAEGVKPYVYPESWAVLYKDGRKSDRFAEPEPNPEIHAWVHVPEKPLSSARSAFMTLWDGINGKREGCAWDANPWILTVSFRRID